MHFTLFFPHSCSYIQGGGGGENPVIFFSLFSLLKLSTTLKNNLQHHNVFFEFPGVAYLDGAIGFQQQVHHQPQHCKHTLLVPRAAGTRAPILGESRAGESENRENQKIRRLRKSGESANQANQLPGPGQALPEPSGAAPGGGKALGGAEPVTPL